VGAIGTGLDGNRLLREHHPGCSRAPGAGAGGGMRAKNEQTGEHKASEFPYMGSRVKGRKATISATTGRATTLFKKTTSWKAPTR
jgi:hypothetical protein